MNTDIKVFTTKGGNYAVKHLDDGRGKEQLEITKIAFSTQRASTPKPSSPNSPSSTSSSLSPVKTKEKKPFNKYRVQNRPYTVNPDTPLTGSHIVYCISLIRFKSNLLMLFLNL